MATPTFEQLCEYASREVRGHATPAEVRHLEADLDAWAAALRSLIAKVDDQARQRELEIAQAKAAGGDQLARRRADYFEWARRSRWFQSHIVRRLEQLNARRAQQLHQQLRRIADVVSAGVADGGVADDDLEALDQVLDALDEADPLPEDALAIAN